MTQSVLVTGASGHIGNNLIRELLAAGRRVRAMIHERDPRALAGLDVEQVRGDVRDPDSLRAAIQGVDTVFHLAAHISISPDEDALTHPINTEGTRNIAATCLRAGVRRLVHMSSVHALQAHPAVGYIDEQTPFADAATDLPYDRSKVGGERAVLQAVHEGLDAVIVNPAGVIGPHDYRPSAQGAALLDIAERRIPALVKGGYNFVDVRDVVHGALRAEATGRRGERYLLTGHSVSIGELAGLVRQCTGRPTPTFETPLWLARASVPIVRLAARAVGKRPLFTVNSLRILDSCRDFRHDKARRELDYSPRPLLDTVCDTLDWFRSQGQLSR